MFRIEMLPAGHGDCLWIEYGDPKAPHRILIDGGTIGTYRKSLRPRLQALDAEFELLVITHIDADHIGGALELLEDTANGFRAKDIWFNGYRHLPDEAPDVLGPVQGEQLTDLLLQAGRNWNGAFSRSAVVVPADGGLPRIELDGGLVLTLLSPTPAQLSNLKPAWEQEVIKAGLDPNRPQPEPTEAESEATFEVLGRRRRPDVDALADEPFSGDHSEANGSSIAFLAEYEGCRVLLAGDAFPEVLQSSLRRFAPGKKLHLEAFKLPHHGSKSNISRELFKGLTCAAYLFSSNGAYFKHPDEAAVARVVKYGGKKPELVFNYSTAYNKIWDDDALRRKYGYSTTFPEDGEGMTLEWE